MLCHQNGVVVDADQQLAEWFGYELGELIGKTVAELIEPTLFVSADEACRCLHLAVGVRKNRTRFGIDLLRGCACRERQGESIILQPL